MCAPGRTWPWTPGPGGPIHAAAGQRWHFVGDSITADVVQWYAEPGGFVDQLNALVGGAGVTVTASGIAGDEAVWLASQVHERVAIFNPDVVVPLIGINDVRVNEATAVYAAAYESILYGLRAELPNAQILVVSMLVKGEQWASNPLRWAPSADNFIDEKNAAVQPLCTKYGAVYADVRDHALLYEQAHNTPEPGADLGILTWNVDDFHPGSTGKIQMGTWVMERVVTP